MKRLFEVADQYIKTSDWKTIAVLKFCLLALGIIIGVNVSKEHKKKVLTVCMPVFLMTYVPLMRKLIKLYVQE